MYYVTSAVKLVTGGVSLITVWLLGHLLVKAMHAVDVMNEQQNYEMVKIVLWRLRRQWYNASPDA